MAPLSLFASMLCMVTAIYGCGISQVQQGRVIAGETAKPGAWPWQVALYYGGQFLCGGSLVSPTWVVTAAHCTNRRYASYLTVVVGDHDRSAREGYEQTVQVSRIAQHFMYNYPSAINNDISMLKLAKPVQFNARVQPVCLPGKNDAPAVGTECFITGWGKVQHPGGSVQRLQQAALNVISHQTCYNKNTRNLGIEITDKMICAGHGPYDRRSGCHGDSGGPFVCRGANGAYTLHGDVSWGSPRCSTREGYSVFARTTEFVDWINANLST